ncbi:MAG: DUF1232 domain-containing protein [Cyanobacteria bacterium RU_5_0]|nr:DUF1232 domain-containing protein [Cyanobacteria bacterium RU_5_0]
MEWYRNLIRHPKYRWFVIIGTLIYLVSPIDIIPDVFPIVGQIDDALLVTLLVAEVSQLLLDRTKTTKGEKNSDVVVDQPISSATPVDVKSVQVD